MTATMEFHCDGLPRRTRFAPRLLLPGGAGERLEIGSEVHMQPLLRPRSTTPSFAAPTLLWPRLLALAGVAVSVVRAERAVASRCACAARA